MLLGRHKTIITPKMPCQLAGFEHRTESAHEKYGDLYLRTTLLQDEDTTLCFFVADIIWWDDELVQILRKKISKKEKLPEQNLHFLATHNHSGPQVSNRFSEKLGTYHEGFVQQLIEKACESVKQAKNNMEPVVIEVRKAEFDLGVYRRKFIDGVVEMAPNGSVEVDNDLTVISFLNQYRQEIATWIHYSCHPTTTDENILSAEFPGVCTTLLEKEEKNSVVSFFQGFCGDIRPGLIENGEFYRGSLEEMISTGDALCQSIKQLKKEPSSPEKHIKLKVSETSLALDYDSRPLSTDVPESLYEEWKFKKDRHNIEELRIYFINISEHLSLMLVNAEMTQAYGKSLKKLDNFILPTGYANGMLGYIVTKKQLENGGYESENSIYYFSMKGKLHPKMEEQIKKRFKQLKEDDDGTSKKRNNRQITI